MSTDRSGTDSPNARVLVPIHEWLPLADAERLLETAAAIAREQDAEMLVASLAVFARQTPLDAVQDNEDAALAARESAQEYVETAREFDISASGVAVLTHDETHSILELIEERECDGVILAVDPTTTQRRRLLSGDTVESVVARAECEVFVEKQREERAPIESVLCAVDGGPHSKLAAETARAIAFDTGATVTIVHYIKPDPSMNERERSATILNAAEEVLSEIDALTVEECETEAIPKAIINRSDRYDYTVLGAPTSGLLQQFTFGTVPERVNQGSRNAVVMAQADTGDTSRVSRWLTGDPIK
ncbi:universal stress protein [Halococcus thailandensis]|nr:universal stress protein [Halococcus thailandensis]